MQIDAHINALREELQRVASLGDEKTAHAAELLSVALESSLARRLQDILAEATLELNSQLDDRHVEIRIAGRDLELVLVREDGGSQDAADEAFSARITLRLPESLKQRIESSASREGASVNTWLVAALQRAVESRRPSSSSRNRLTGYGRS
ncbi:MAG TPA: toxin-antitoxin system HicB family antitoxin [Gaiellaceae bacterium]|jgi:predicted DNA binding CopG/RHH family protein